jgi:hypothetical protein
MNKKISMLILALPLVILAGCDQYYRYPCQNPANWEQDFCKKPLCEVNRDCPEYIFEPEEAVEQTPALTTNEGVCK